MLHQIWLVKKKKKKKKKTLLFHQIVLNMYLNLIQIPLHLVECQRYLIYPTRS